MTTSNPKHMIWTWKLYCIFEIGFVCFILLSEADVTIVYSSGDYILGVDNYDVFQRRHCFTIQKLHIKYMYKYIKEENLYMISFENLVKGLMKIKLILKKLRINGTLTVTVACNSKKKGEWQMFKMACNSKTTLNILLKIYLNLHFMVLNNYAKLKKIIDPFFSYHLETLQGRKRKFSEDITYYLGTFGGRV